MIKGIANVVFKVSDVNRSCDFFEKKLGLKIAYREANWAEETMAPAVMKRIAEWIARQKAR